MASATPGFEVGIVDINRDAMPDLVIAVNDDKTKKFLNQTDSNRQTFVVRLDGPKGNLTGIGAQIVLKSRSGNTTTREVYSASGYLSQSSGELFFSLDKDDLIESVTIRWPDGSTDTRVVEDANRRLVFKKPNS